MSKETQITILFVIIQVQLSFGNEAVLYSKPVGSNDWKGKYCLFYNPYFNALPDKEEDGEKYKLIDLSSVFGCNASDFDPVPVISEQLAVVVSRGNCTFAEKARNAQAVGLKAVLVASDELLTPGASNETEYNEINITVAVALWDNIHDIQKSGADSEILLYASGSDVRFDPNIALIFAIAVSCVTIAGLWAGHNKHNKYVRLQERQKRKELADTQAGSDTDTGDEEEEDEESVDITLPAIIVFFILVCTFIVLLYFFYDQLVYAVIGLFCLAGAMGMYSCLHPIWKKLVPFKGQVPPNRVPFLRHRPEYRNMVFGLICIGVGVWWGIERHAPYSWILQDILGYMFCINVMKSVCIPNLKICTVMLGLLFVYDIFFVFITPLLTSTGDSIMVKVATGGHSKTKETIPMAYRVPKLSPAICPQAESLLGFGDIVIPGLLICYNHAFDLRAGTRKLYFISTVIAYAIGLLITFMALYLMETGQPALLYIVPCILITTYFIGCLRGDVKRLWTGLLNPNESDSNSNACCHGNATGNQSNQAADGNTSVTSEGSDTSNENRELIKRR